MTTHSTPPPIPHDPTTGLDSLDADNRMNTLCALLTGAPDRFASVEEKREVNLHAHTIFSYNPYHYSPARFAWLARTYGLAVAGIVDFDVLDGVDEFHRAGTLLNLRTCASIESRVFVPEFADRVINSPGEPGIAYHMGVGFVSSTVPPAAATFLDSMRARADQRTRTLVEKVNAFLDPLQLDLDHELLPLTPNGNATERHVCEAYARKAAQTFSGDTLAAFWTKKLGPLPAGIDLPDGPKLQALLRAKTMKQGGVGYAPPDPSSFPLMADMNRFALACGAIPTLAWLDGASPGEQAMEELIATAKASGVAALNIIPDRNFTPGVADTKLEALYDVVTLADRHGFPVIVGTEMNSPGNKFVDDFASDELAPLTEIFLRGAFIVYAHTVLQRLGGLGYTSPWAARHFPDPHQRNAFYADLGTRLQPSREDRLAPLTPSTTPAELTARL
jgi:hypothetical protein